MGILSRRAGHPVTYAELQSAGIEFPANLVAELELAGVEIDRCYSAGSGGQVVRAVRLPATAREVPPQPPSATEREPTLPRIAPAARSKGVHGYGRLLRPLALLVAVAVITGLVLAGLSAGNGRSKFSDRHHGHSSTSARTAGSGSRRHPKATPAAAIQRRTTTTSPQFPRLPTTPVSTPLASALEARGHDVLTAGQYTAAVPILERAVAATGEHIAACVEPTTQSCLTYAYALFDLGRALLLSGRAAPAVAVLKQRLQIDNQRPEVAAQLALARQS